MLTIEGNVIAQPLRKFGGSHDVREHHASNGIVALLRPGKKRCTRTVDPGCQGNCPPCLIDFNDLFCGQSMLFAVTCIAASAGAPPQTKDLAAFSFSKYLR